VKTDRPFWGYINAWLIYQFENGLQNGQILISRLNVANSEICENGVTRKIPHGDFEKLASKF
jgi:hypothetical protein